MENTIMDNYEIKLDRRVLKQLGSQLYGDTPSVIAELVANSYDADANNVWITIDTVNNNVIVEDDGKGMTAGDINESFLNIGYDKRSVNDAEKQVVQEENLQFTRAVNNGKQTKKIFISHKEEHKLYGQFIVDVLETYGVDVVSTIIFTGDRRLGVPQGKDIYDYLKDCFREDLMVIFLFSKAFYDSNICISEAGAAWATNQNCMNVVIDISFSDIEKPSNNALSSIKFQQIRTPDQTITVTEFFKTIIEEGLHFEYDESKLQKALNYVLKTDKYSDQKIDFPATFLPKRKFLPVPRCPKCHNIMLLTEENGRLKYVCSNVSCDECYEAVIN